MTQKPKRVQLSRKKGWRKPEGCVVVARPSKWGNPYRVVRSEYSVNGTEIRGRELREWNVMEGDDEVRACEVRATALKTAVHLFDGMLRYDTELLAAVRAELRGKDLACWCPLDAPCHADVLLEVANQ